MSAINVRATATTRARYNRVAPLYDQMERGKARRSLPWRAALWRRVTGPRVLEVGVGTAASLPLYPRGMAITAIDFAPHMLERARQHAREAGIAVDLAEADVQALPFPDASFDSIIATFVFCSVPDPLLGLRELRRVLVPGGQFLLLEHVLSERSGGRRVMRAASPLIARMIGANIDRETVETITRAGFLEITAEDKWLDVVNAITARAPGLDGSS